MFGALRSSPCMAAEYQPYYQNKPFNFAVSHPSRLTCGRKKQQWYFANKVTACRVAWTLAGVALASREDHAVSSAKLPQTACKYRKQAVYEAVLMGIWFLPQR
jgi:hypothetical protein